MQEFQEPISSEPVKPNEPATVLPTASGAPLDTGITEKASKGPGVNVSKLNATVSEVVRLNENLVIFKLTPEAPIADFKPGQYVSVGLYAASQRRDPTISPDSLEPTKMIERAYSIASSPEQKGHLEFCISILPYGQLTSRLVMVEPGDKVFVRSKITGTFHIDAQKNIPAIPADKDLILVATGTGIAPFISMLRTSTTWTQGRSITLVHGVRKNEDLAYREEMLELEKKHPNFKYLAAVSREEPLPGAHKGRVTHLFESGTINADPVRDYVLLCGNPEMIEGPNSVTTLLGKQGFSERTKQNPEGHLLFEKYW